MPLYEYKCECCGFKQTRFLPLERYQEPQYCRTPNCANNGILESSVSMTKLVAAPAVQADYPGYISPATGQWVEGRKAHIEDLKRSGCRVFEPGEREQSAKKAQERQQKLEKEIDVAVEQTAAQLGINS